SNRVSSLGLAPDLQVDSLDQAGRVQIRAAGGHRAAGSGDGGKKLSDARGLGGGLNLVGLERGNGGIGGEGGYNSITRRPIHGADGICYVDVIPGNVAVGIGPEKPGLPLREAVVLRLRRAGWGEASDLNAVDVLVDVDGSLRDAGTAGDSSYVGGSGSAWTAYGGGHIPGAGAGGAIAGDRNWRGAVRVTALDDELNVNAEDGAAGGILGAGAKNLGATYIHGNSGARAQRNARHPSVAGITAALAEAASEGDDEDDGQSKKKTGTATMHEPSSYPFARHEHYVDRWKTVSVEGHGDFEQAAKFRQPTETGPSTVSAPHS